MAKVKVTMLGDSWNTKAGDVREVDSEMADQLIADGHAIRTSEASPAATPSGAEPGSTATRSGTAKKAAKKS